MVSKDNGFFQTNVSIAGIQNLGDRLLGHLLVNHRKRKAFRNNVKQKNPAYCRINNGCTGFSCAIIVENAFGNANLDARLQMGVAGLVSSLNFLRISKNHALTLGIHTLSGHVVKTQNNILRGHDYRLSVSGSKYVVGRHHQRSSLQLRFQRQRDVNSHLVTIEISVVSSTDKRMQLDCLTLDEHRFKSLNTQSVKRGRPVQKHRMLADDLSQDIPDFSSLTLHHLLGCLDRCGQTASFQFAEDERFKQLERHLLG